MTPPSSCLAHTRNCKKREKNKYRLAPTDPSPKVHDKPPPPPSSFHPHSPSQKIFTCKAHKVKTRTHSLGNATQTHPPTSHPQPILVLHPLSPGRHTPSSRTHRRTRPSQPSPPRKVSPSHPRSRHPLLLRIAPSLRPRSTLPSILPHFTPLAPHTRLRPAESENPGPSPPS